jgi:Tat protein translocase TatB subunit
MGIGNIGWSEFIVILAFALIFFGPRRLPGIAQAIGKSLREFQKALNEVKSEIAQASKEADTGPELKRISPRPAEFFTPDPAVAESAPASEEPETAEGADAAAPELTRAWRISGRSTRPAG